MIKFIFLFAIAITSAMSANADPIEGLWRTHYSAKARGFLVVDVSPCGEKFCGKILYAVDEGGVQHPEYRHAGRDIIWDMVPAGKGRYENGQIFDPNSNKTYKARLVFKGKRLKVKACIAAALCSTLTWKRLK